MCKNSQNEKCGKVIVEPKELNQSYEMSLDQGRQRMEVFDE